MKARFAPLAVALVALAALACTAPPTAPGPATPAKPAPAPAEARPAPPPAAPVDPRLAGLNLSFEDSDGLEPWMINGVRQAAEADGSQAHAGKRSLRIDEPASGGDSFVAVVGTLPLDAVRGKRVHVSAWIRAEQLGGGMGLWLRADGANAAVVAFGGTHAQPVTGTADWTRREFTVDVPANTTGVYFGGFVSGPGRVWLDDVQVVIEEPPARAPVAVSGRVVDAGGQPVAGALVAASEGSEPRPHQVVVTGDDGRFALELRTGDWAFTATSPRGVGVYRPSEPLGKASEVELQLGAEGGFTVTGKVTWTGPAVPGARVHCTRFSDVNGDVFVVPVASDGTWSARLPVMKNWMVELVAEGAVTEPAMLAESKDTQVELVPAVLGPPPDEVVAHVGKQTVRLTGVEAGQGFADLAGFGKLVGDARIVALGEATHGSREFFQMKHRALEYLVEKKGFTLFAIEANQPECRRVNDYVVDGKGTAAEAVAGMYFWTWDTEEVVAMVEWMRAYNADPKHKKKVRFAGFDMQTTKVAWPAVVAYLSAVDPAYTAALPAGLAGFAEDRIGVDWFNLPAAERKARLVALAEVLARFDAERVGYQKRSSPAAWAQARHDARVVQQAAEMYEAGEDGFAGGFDVRDRAMAENVGWLLDQEGPKGRKTGKIVLWAHNGHIAHEMKPFANMGSHLTKEFGKAYLPIGFVFGEGGFQAMGQGKAPRGLGEHTVGAPPEADMSQAFLRAGIAVGVLDLRKLPAGTVARWFAAPHPMREIGAVFFDEASMSSPQRLSQRFGAVIFVAKTTRARPMPTGVRPAKK